MINETQNLTYLMEKIPTITSSIYSFVIVLILIFLFSLFFNILSIVSIFTARAYTPINLLIINLGLADITYTLGIPFFIIQLLNYNLPFNVIGCKLFIFTEFSGIIVGILTVAALSVERFLDVTDKKHKLDAYSNKLKLLIVIIYSIMIWILATCFSLPIILSIKLIEINNVSSCQSDWEDATLRLYFIAKFLIIFILPYSIIIISSVKLLVFLNEWKKKFNKKSNEKKKFFIRKKSNILFKFIHRQEKENNEDIELERSNKNEKKQTTSTKTTSDTEVLTESTILVHKQTQYYLENVSVTSNENATCMNNTKYNSFYLTVSSSPQINYNLSKYHLSTDLNQSLNLDAKYETKIDRNFLDLYKNYFNKKICKKVEVNEKVKKKKRSANKNLKYINSVRRKAVRLVLVIILLFLAQWSPFWIFQILMLFSTANIKYIQLINMAVSTLSYSNTVANPALYMLLTYNFKENCRKACSKLSCRFRK